MDFSFSSDQQDLRDLAHQILADATTLERVKTVMADADGFDRDLWAALCEAGLVGISLPESVGGAGLGFLETCIVLEEVGRTAAPVPAIAVLGYAAPALVEYGATDALAGVADGSRIVAGAFTEAVGDPATPATTAKGRKLTGTKVCVPAGLWADLLLVTADDGLYVVDPSADGVTVVRQDTMMGAPAALVELRDAPGEKIAGPEGVAYALQHAQTALSVTMAGGCQTALELTSEYVKERKQFGRAIATFQAASQRTADAYIDTEAVKLTAWQAAWRLDAGHEADTQVATAKFWAADGAQHVLRAAHHLHGGVGVDRDYPLHRYYLLAKHVELDLGSETPSLVRLGKILADTPV
jgi:acyl-CoA dehydrogenase